MALKHITTEEEFTSEVKEASGLVIIDFWAPWCGPCKMLGPIFEKAAEDDSDVTFIKVDIDEAEEIASNLGIRSIPTLKIFKDGKEVDESMGAMSPDQLKEFIAKNK